ncbi:MAG: hypothetical protein E6H00_06425 [Bacillati bacterium ANGP1]|uniref:Uncharacterized protein n=1 Tax=Candidatus Segetimicrobium genomatis TaxID=2569760 RepID=A0A537K4F7_9BACT|nr:MAG: hypothetical protein E6H00_06425 [Terrabacteria group bacterium ANGP1]
MRMGTDRGGGVLAGALGIAVFLIGALLLLAVFYFAYTELIASGALSSSSGASSPSGGLALLVATKGLFLFIMGFAASAIANKGIGLYQVALHAEREP